MAIDNAFRTDETKIKSEPLTELYILFHVVKSEYISISQNDWYYVSATKGQPYYDDYGIYLKLFQQNYFMLRAEYMAYKNITFESFEIEIIFRELFNLK
jgi:hypothetical protein